jgi:HAD superfamily phosphatase (TIGR01668 family)
MFKYFIPDYLFDGIFDIPEDFFEKLDIRAVIFDIDNTLVKDGYPFPEEKTKEYIYSLRKKGIAVAIASNNNEERVRKFVESFDCDIAYSFKSGKPKKSSLQTVLNTFRQQPSHVALVGDQILTDVIAANLNGIISVYVKPIDTTIENAFFVLKRILERPFLGIYRLKHKKKGK